MKPTLLGIDAGGSGITAVATREGRVLHRGTGGPANPLAARRQVELSFAGALAGCPRPDVAVACVAGAGAPRGRRPVQRLLSDRFSGCEIAVLPDYAAAWATAPPDTDLLVLAGTGSVICSADRAGGLQVSGGLGYLIGDHGSAARLGRALLDEHALDPFEGLDNSLTDLIGTTDPAGVALALTSSSAPAALLGAVAPLVTDAAENGDQRARGILEAEMAALSRLAAIHARRHAIDCERPRLALAGGVFSSVAARGVFGEALAGHGITGELVRSAAKPVDGALRLAAARAGR